MGIAVNSKKYRSNNCPFCGESHALYFDEIGIDDHTEFFMVCRRCGCEGPTAMSEKEAARNWMRRVK